MEGGKNPGMDEHIPDCGVHGRETACFILLIKGDFR
jgi:hypothetical protein